MQADYEKELTPEVQEKMKKNLVYIGIFSVVMLFAGFSSAYIVSMGDAFWLKYDLPPAFYWSTLVIGLSSLTYWIAGKKSKANEAGGARLLMGATVLFGVLFVILQIRGYSQLTEMGAYAVNNHIIVTDGRYGDYYSLKLNGEELSVNGNRFTINGKELNDKQWALLKEELKPFAIPNPESDFDVKSGGPVQLFFKGEPLAYMDGTVKKYDGTSLEFTDRLRLAYLAMNIQEERGDFFLKGQLGEDFNIYYKGEALEYVNRNLQWKGKPLNKYLQLKATETADTGTSFLYILTFLHLLHIVVAIIYLLKVTVGVVRAESVENKYLSIKLGGMFWHFLGLLWLYLLLFLLFIH